MAKIALLIGVSEYEAGLNPLPSAVKDVEAMQQVLLRSDIGGFVQSDITVLKNSPRQQMEEEIEKLFQDRQKDDLLLLFFSGHGIKDDTGKLYLATRQTRKTTRGQLSRSSAVAANFVHDSMERSRSKRQVVILDSCFSGAFAEGLSAKDDGSVNIREQLGGEGRAVLTSSSSTQYSFEQQGLDLSIYTHYLIEGMTTGAADVDEDGVVSIDELHEYASRKVREIQPAMKPELYAIREGFKIKLTKVPPGDLKEKYSKEVRRYVSRGDVSFVGRKILDAQKIYLKLSEVEARAIEDEILTVVRQEFREKLQRYERDFTEAIQQEVPLREAELDSLRENLQQILGLRNEDIQPIEIQVRARIEAYKQPLQKYEQAFTEAIVQEYPYPLSETTRRRLQQMQQQWGLTAENVASIESRITAEIDAYRQKLRQYEQAFTRATEQEYPLTEGKRNELRQQQQNLDLKDGDIAPIESRIIAEIEAYRQNLQQYEQALTKATHQEYPLSQRKRIELRQQQQNFGLKSRDIALIESRITVEIEAYRQKLQQYEQAFTKATQQEYPLTEGKRNQLRQEQQNLGLKDGDIAPIEARITAEVEAYHQKLQDYEQVLKQTIQYEYPISNEIREELKRYQEVLELRDEDVAKIEARVTSEDNAIPSSDQDLGLPEIQIQELQPDIEVREKSSQVQLENSLQIRAREAEQLRQQSEAEYQKKLKRYEQEVNKTVQEGNSLDSYYIRDRLRQLQRTLGLTDSDVKSIETRLVSQREIVTPSAQPNSTTQPSVNYKNTNNQQPGIVSSKKARRSVLLASTALGLALIFSRLSSGNVGFFVWGNVIILIGGACVVFWGKPQDLASWRRKVMVGGIVVSGIGLVWFFLLLSSSTDITMFSLIFVASIFSLIFLTSIYIGRW